MIDAPHSPIERDPARLQDALPWYLNGTLAPQDRAWVEEMLAAEEAEARAAGAAPLGREQLALDRQLAETLQRQLAEVPADIGWSELLQRVRADAAPQRAAASGPRFVDRVPWMQRFSRLVSPILSPQAGMAMAMLVVAQTVAIGLLVSERQSDTADTSEYRSTGAAPPISAIRALFDDSVTERALREALTAHGASIVDGPNPLGEYWIVTGERDPEAVASALRQAGIIASYVIDQRGAAR